jgi:hypothetical protein
LKSGFRVSNDYGGRGSVKIELTKDWREFLSLLIAHQVKFVLVGGHAVAGHAEARLTEDLDVFVEPSQANAKRLRAALTDFGFGAVAPPVAELAGADKIFMLGEKPYRIDILTGVDGVSFRDAWATKVEADFDPKPLFVIGRDALIANKQAAGRPKDLLDLALLSSHKPIAQSSSSSIRPSAKRKPTLNATKTNKTTKKRAKKTTR